MINAWYTAAHLQSVPSREHKVTRSSSLWPKSHKGGLVRFGRGNALPKTQNMFRAWLKPQGKWASGFCNHLPGHHWS